MMLISIKQVLTCETDLEKWADLIEQIIVLLLYHQFLTTSTISNKRSDLKKSFIILILSFFHIRKGINVKITPITLYEIATQRF